MVTLLDAAIIEDALNNLPEWSGGTERLTRTANLSDDLHAELERRVTVAADAMNHHPEIERSGDQTRFTLSTHSAGGVTEMDIALASEIDSLLRLVKGEPPTPVPAEVVSAHAVSASRDEGHEGPTASTEKPAAEEFMGVPAAAQGTPVVPLPDTAPHAPEPGVPDEQDPGHDEGEGPH